MPMRSLEIENFKSWGGRHEIVFSGFTAVVGPNGAGKSNLMDAVSFVLGIHARHLRSSKLSELLHKGVGDQSVGGARVALKYVNESDGREIVFSRTISPLGLGTYRVDGSEKTRDEYESRLREIGVLVKARNFLVFQGDVESLARKNATDLTKLFEQTSGSEEVKVQYEELKAAKEAAEETLLLAAQARKTLGTQKRQMKEQRDEADSYAALTEELAEKRTDHFLWHIHEVRGEMTEHMAKLEALRLDVDAAKAEEEGVVDLGKAERKAMAFCSRRCASVEKSVTAERSQLRSTLEPEVAARREALKAAQSKSAAEAKAAAKLDEQLEAQRDALKVITEELQTLEAEEAGLKETEEEEGWLCDEGLREEYEALQRRADAASSTASRDLARARRDLDARTTELSELNARRADLSQRREANLGDLDRYKKRLEESKAVAKTATGEIGRNNATLAASSTDDSTLQAEQRKLENELAVLTEDLRQVGGGSNTSQKDAAIMERVATLKRLFPGVKGRLVDVCAPTQRKFAVAVATAVGKFAEALVVDTKECAHECMNYLRDQRLGTAIFLPLDTIEPKRVDERLRGLGSQFRLAIDVIQNDPDVAAAVAFAAGDVLICDTLDDARAVCYGTTSSGSSNPRLARLMQNRPQVKAVTLEGAVIAKSGNMTGGRDGRAGAGRAWRDAEATRLTDRKGALDAKLEKLRGERREADYSLPKLRREVGIAEARRDYALRDVEAVEKKIAELKKGDNLASILATCDTELKEKDAETAAAREALEALDRAVLEARSSLFGAFAKRQGLEVEAIAVMGAQRLEAQKRTVAALARCEERRAKLEAQRSYEERRDLPARLASLGRRGREADKKLKEASEALESVLADERAAMGRVAEKSAELTAEKGKLEECRDRLKALQLEKDQAARLAVRKQREAGAEETQLEKLRSELHDIAQRAQVAAVHLPHVDDKPAAPREEEEESEEESEEEEEEEATKKRKKGSSSSSSKKKKKKKQRRSTRSRPAQSPIGATDDTGSTRFSSGMMEHEDVVAVEGIDTSRVASRAAASTLSRSARDREYEEAVSSLEGQLAKLSPNMKAAQLWEEYSQRHKAAEKDYAAARDVSSTAARDFDDVKDRRYKTFMDCFDAVSATLATLYAEMTRSARHPLGGAGSLAVLDVEEPYNGGIAFHATPPGKRFCEISQLSGGERTLASLSLLFALHGFRAAPFIIMDEVDAALDTVNVGKLINFIKQQAKSLQIVAVSLKDQFYIGAASLVGIAKDQAAQSSEHFSLSLE